MQNRPEFGGRLLSESLGLQSSDKESVPPLPTTADPSRSMQVRVWVALHASEKRRWEPRSVSCVASATYAEILHLFADITSFKSVRVNEQLEPVDDRLCNSVAFQQSVAANRIPFSNEDQSQKHSKMEHQSPLAQVSPASAPSSSELSSGSGRLSGSLRLDTSTDQLLPQSQPTSGSLQDSSSTLRIQYELASDIKNCPCLGCKHLLLPRSSRRICDCCHTSGHWLSRNRILCVQMADESVGGILHSYEHWKFSMVSERDGDRRQPKQVGVEMKEPEQKSFYAVFGSSDQALLAMQEASRLRTVQQNHTVTWLNNSQLEYRLRMMSHFWKLVAYAPGRKLDGGKSLVYPKIGKCSRKCEHTSSSRTGASCKARTSCTQALPTQSDATGHRNAPSTPSTAVDMQRYATQFPYSTCLAYSVIPDHESTMVPSPESQAPQRYSSFNFVQPVHVQHAKVIDSKSTAAISNEPNPSLAAGTPSVSNLVQLSTESFHNMRHLHEAIAAQLSVYQRDRISQQSHIVGTQTVLIVCTDVDQIKLLKEVGTITGSGTQRPDPPGPALTHYSMDVDAPPGADTRIVGCKRPEVFVDSRSMQDAPPIGSLQHGGSKRARHAHMPHNDYGISSAVEISTSDSAETGSAEMNGTTPPEDSSGSGSLEWNANEDVSHRYQSQPHRRGIHPNNRVRSSCLPETWGREISSSSDDSKEHYADVHGPAAAYKEADQNSSICHRWRSYWVHSMSSCWTLLFQAVLGLVALLLLVVAISISSDKTYTPASANTVPLLSFVYQFNDLDLVDDVVQRMSQDLADIYAFSGVAAAGSTISHLQRVMRTTITNNPPFQQLLTAQQESSALDSAKYSFFAFISQHPSFYSQQMWDDPIFVAAAETLCDALANDFGNTVVESLCVSPNDTVWGLYLSPAVNSSVVSLCPSNETDSAPQSKGQDPLVLLARPPVSRTRFRSLYPSKAADPNPDLEVRHFANGNGNGNRDGHGSRSGNGNGNGNENGNGNTDGSASGNSNGNDNGNADGNASGNSNTDGTDNGNGNGNSNTDGNDNGNASENSNTDGTDNGNGNGNADDDRYTNGNGNGNENTTGTRNANNNNNGGSNGNTESAEEESVGLSDCERRCIAVAISMLDTAINGPKNCTSSSSSSTVSTTLTDTAVAQRLLLSTQVASTSDTLNQVGLVLTSIFQRNYEANKDMYSRQFRVNGLLLLLLEIGAYGLILLVLLVLVTLFWSLREVEIKCRRSPPPLPPFPQPVSQPSVHEGVELATRN